MKIPITLLITVLFCTVLSGCDGAKDGEKEVFESEQAGIDSTKEHEVLNIAPIVNAGMDLSIKVNQTMKIRGNASDSDGTIVKYEWKNGSIIIATTASFDFSSISKGAYVLTLTVTDNNGKTASDSIKVIVIEAEEVANQAPVAKNITVNIYKNSTKTITLEGTDADGNALSYHKVSDPAQGIVEFNGNTVIYTPSGNFTGNDSFIYKVNDGKADSLNAFVFISISVSQKINKTHSNQFHCNYSAEKT